MKNIFNSRSVVGPVERVNALVGGALTINALGDSISCQATYQPATASLSLIPAWQPSTAYTASSPTSIVQNNGNAYICKTSGTSASSGGPTTTSADITDGSAHWTYLGTKLLKTSFSYLKWAESFSLGRLVWDMSQGYGGVQSTLIRVIVSNGGSNYSPSDTLTLNNGATGTLNVVNGVIQSATITNPGYNTTTSYTYSITTSTGSGAVLSLVSHPAGTFGVPGCMTQDMVARLPDVLASAVDIVVVRGGTNDITNAKAYSAIIANLQTCYETLMAGGKKVVAFCITPINGLTPAQNVVLLRVNRWIRAYCRKESWANPSGYNNIALADPTRYWTDGTSTTNQPIGGAGVSAYAMTQDGKHPSPRGAQYDGLTIWQAAQRWAGSADNSPARSATLFDGYDPTANPTGNLLEALPWTANTAYSNLQGLVCNDTAPVKVYRLKAAGTSASSGGPTGTGSTINDNTCQWAFVANQGRSVFGSSTGGTQTAATGVTYSGNLAGGWTIARTVGTGTGTVTCAIENPWSDGQVGTRQSIAFSLGSGTVNEQWQVNPTALNSTIPVSGLATSDRGVAYIYAEMEVELSGVANLSQLSLVCQDATDQIFVADGSTASTLVQGQQLMKSSGEMLSYPNGGKILLKTQPFLMPSNMTAITVALQLGFDASGGSDTATLTLKCNWCAVRKAYTA